MSRQTVVDGILAALLVGLLLGFVLGRLTAPVLAASTPRAGQNPPSAQLGAPTESARVSVDRRSAPPSPTPARGAPIVGVVATWYCNTDAQRGPLSRCARGHPDARGEDLYAAISPDLTHLRGRVVLVCVRGSVCVSVRVVDCDCRARHSIDLYADAFEALGPLGRGRLTVTVEHG